MLGQEPGTLAHSQGLWAGKGAKGGPDWAEIPPLRSDKDERTASVAGK